MILETKRLILREMVQGDYISLCKMLQDKDVMYAYEGAFNDDEAHAWLDKQINRYNKGYGIGIWAVILKETNEMIGQCGLTMQEYKDKQLIEIGYLFEKAFWHNGYATEAAIACKEYAFEKLNAREVFCMIRDTNIPSQNVAKRNGMTNIDKFTRCYRGIDIPHFLFVVYRGF